MRIFLFLLAVGLAVPFAGYSQDILTELATRRTGEGVVTVHQDTRLSDLLGKPVVSTGNAGEKKVLKSAGYRIQVYAGNNSRKAKEEASEKAAEVNQYFPDLPVYTHFSSPRWLCRVGDFKSIEEADAIMRKLKATGAFKEISIVKEIINIPL